MAPPSRLDYHGVPRGSGRLVVTEKKPPRMTTALNTETRVPLALSVLRALRPHQWSKNLLIFVPLFVGHGYGDPAKIVATALGFVLLCTLASATYMINDIADLEADRAHPTKRLRPFASGSLPVTFGLTAAPVIILAALGGAYLLSPGFAAIAARLLRRHARLFVRPEARAAARRVRDRRAVHAAHRDGLRGRRARPFAMAARVRVRVLPLARARQAPRRGVPRGAHRRGGDRGRGYRGDDWPITLSFGIGTGLVSVVIMLLYMTNDAAPSGFYRQEAWLYAMPALVSLWLMRIWLLSHRLELHDDPVVFALKDRASLGLGVIVAVVFWMAH